MSDSRKRGGGVTGAKLATAPEISLVGTEDIGKDGSVDDMSAGFLDEKGSETQRYRMAFVPGHTRAATVYRPSESVRNYVQTKG